MKKFFSILLTFLCSFQLFSKLIVYDIDDSNFPRMKAKVLVFDSSGNVVVDLHKDDFVVIEEGIQREVLSFNCIQSAQSRNLSSVLCIDISGSMGEDNKIDIVKEVAKLWVDLLDPNTTECAITSFDDQFYLNQGFTTNKDLLKKAINSLMIG
ncbi:MAG: VWA domain-containing protein, partial [Candidatus Kapaibacteriota bacterium]